MYEPVSADALCPQIWNLRLGEIGSRLSLRLTTVPDKTLVSLTGGCGNLPEAQAGDMYELFVKAFDGFTGAMLFGGTRMRRAPDYTQVRPGITEIPPLIRRYNPDCRILGIVPLQDPPVEFDPLLGLVVSREPRYVTIVNPAQDACLIIQASADSGSLWDEEWKYRLRLTDCMREEAGFRSLLVAYNGGQVTEREIVATAQQGWSVLLVKGSGGSADRYAANQAFRDRYPNVHVSEATVASLRQTLATLQVINRKD